VRFAHLLAPLCCVRALCPCAVPVRCVRTTARLCVLTCADVCCCGGGGGGGGGGGDPMLQQTLDNLQRMQVRWVQAKTCMDES